MKHQLALFLAAAVSLTAVGFSTRATLAADYPKPSVYPKTWEFKFDYQKPRRIVLEVPGSSVPQAYWYMLYTVTNNGDKEQMFLPVFELLTKEGKLIRSDNKIPQVVFDTIKKREQKKFLVPFPNVQGTLRIGEDQARDGVAIWPEPEAELGNFSIFIGGLSGETAAINDDKGQPMKDADGNPIILRKTLELDYLIRGDEVFPGEDLVNETGKRWVMR